MMMIIRCSQEHARAWRTRPRPTPRPFVVAGRCRPHVSPVTPVRSVRDSGHVLFEPFFGNGGVVRGLKVAQKLALLVPPNVAERGIGSRGHALAMGPSHCDYAFFYVLSSLHASRFSFRIQIRVQTPSAKVKWNRH
jgi:hypothetical protein